MRKLLSLILIMSLLISIASCAPFGPPIPDDAVSIDYSGDIKEVRSSFEEALSSMEEHIVITGLSENFTMEDLLEMDYGSFWVESFTCTSRGKTSVYTMNYYDLSTNAVETMKHEIDEEISSILLTIPAGASSWDKLLRIHDELIRRVSYDEDDIASHRKDCYGALVLHKATCAGYASAFYLISAKINLPCPLVYSETHTWNKMMISSEEKYIDVTWDDIDENSFSGTPYVCHDFFGLTEEEISRIPDHEIIRDTDISMIYDVGVIGNYFSHNGYVQTSYDEVSIINDLTAQRLAGDNVLSVRFLSDEAYFSTKEYWTEDDYSHLLSILSRMGINGDINVWFNDDVKVINIGL